MAEILYKSGYKYQVAQDYRFTVSEEFPSLIHAGDFLRVAGRDVIIKKGYAGDGPSGPTIDTKSFMRGAWEHDALYQLIREEVYPESLREAADKHLIATCEADGMSWARRQWVYYGLRIGGAKSASKSAIKPILRAP